MHRNDSIPGQSTTPSPDARADDNDIYYAYRLLLGREPDENGFQHHRGLLARQRLLPRELAQIFLDAAEFAARNAVAATAEVRLDGYSIFVRESDRDIGMPIRDTQKYEPHVTAAVRALLRPGDTFVDVGANIGIFTNLAAHLVGPRGCVVAIEPMDENLQLIYRSLERNRFEHVHVHACAASDRVALVHMATASITSNGQVLALPADGREGLRTQTKRLDDLCAWLPRIDLVKFDIEGYELFAWRGFLECLRKHRPVVVTEFHPYCMRTYVGIEPSDFLDELFRYGGRVEVLARDGSRIPCATPGDVMSEWERTDKATSSGGTDHLDLLIQPRN